MCAYYQDSLDNSFVWDIIILLLSSLSNVELYALFLVGRTL